MVRADATKLPQPQEVDLSKVIKNSLLITGFPPLPNLNLIFAEAVNHQNLPPSTPLNCKVTPHLSPLPSDGIGGERPRRQN
jgi:hypothetical protein